MLYEISSGGTASGDTNYMITRPSAPVPPLRGHARTTRPTEAAILESAVRHPRPARRPEGHGRRGRAIGLISAPCPYVLRAWGSSKRRHERLSLAASKVCAGRSIREWRREAQNRIAERLNVPADIARTFTPSLANSGAGLARDAALRPSRASGPMLKLRADFEWLRAAPPDKYFRISPSTRSPRRPL